MEEGGGWVERKQLVKTELFLKGGRVCGARDGGDKGKIFKDAETIEVYCS